MAARHHETVFVVGDRQIAIHLLRLGFSQSNLFQRPGIHDAVHRFRALEVTHRQHALQRQQHRLGIARGQQVGQILHRNTQTFYVWQNAVAAQFTRIGG